MVCQRCPEVNGISEVSDWTPKGNVCTVCFTVVWTCAGFGRKETWKGKDRRYRRDDKWDTRSFKSNGIKRRIDIVQDVTSFLDPIARCWEIIVWWACQQGSRNHHPWAFGLGDCRKLVSFTKVGNMCCSSSTQAHLWLPLWRAVSIPCHNKRVS